MPNKKKKKTKRVKYYKAEFKIPESTKKRLRGFCSKFETSENKVFRKALREFLDKNHFHREHYDIQVPVNQMSIFDLLDDTSSTSN